MYEMAYSLGRFVYEIRAMPYDEYLGWQAYFKLQPIGWREDDRTFKLLQIQGFKGNPQEIFNSFKIMEDTHADRPSSIALKGSKMFQLMQKATGGIHLK